MCSITLRLFQMMHNGHYMIMSACVTLKGVSTFLLVWMLQYSHKKWPANLEAGVIQWCGLFPAPDICSSLACFAASFKKTMVFGPSIMQNQNFEPLNSSVCIKMKSGLSLSVSSYIWYWSFQYLNIAVAFPFLPILKNSILSRNKITNKGKKVALRNFFKNILKVHPPLPRYALGS